jgi:hypothetical protein
MAGNSLPDSGLPGRLLAPALRVHPAALLARLRIREVFRRALAKNIFSVPGKMCAAREEPDYFRAVCARPHAKIPLALMVLDSHTPIRPRVSRSCLVFLLLVSFFATARSVSAGPAAAKSIPRRSASFQTRMARILTSRTLRQSFLGVLIVDAGTGQPIYQLNADALFHPASTTKLFTTALALSTLGPGYQFQTALESGASLDATGRLAGDLVLVGRGDPSFSNRHFPYDKEFLRDGPPERPLAEQIGRAHV